ncbi:hypothetical protein OG21DRAFT_1515179 [Imleria badia]|nr:hypothetical protein OG21DRAFT_1515179 [Imleria badia]
MVITSRLQLPYTPFPNNILDVPRLSAASWISSACVPSLVWFKELQHGGIPPTVTTLRRAVNAP